MSAPPLFGLVLAGGASTRMGRDKAELAYHGRSQLEWTFELLAQVCTATFVSVRPDQRDEPTRARFPQIVDSQPGIGPIAGISAALQQHPKVAWLVVACDLPFITGDVLTHLIERRDPQSVATAYRSSHDQLPEPLCAIWEPAARDGVLAHIAGGKQCPRKFLINSTTHLLDLPNARALDNINTSDEFQNASAALAENPDPLTRASGDLDVQDARMPWAHGSAGRASPRRGAETPSPRSDGARGAPLKIKVQYYALFREQAGRSEESLETSAATPAALYRELQARYPFKLAPEQLKVAVNADFRDWNSPLAAGDTVVFIPPVAGG